MPAVRHHLHAELLPEPGPTAADPTVVIEEYAERDERLEVLDEVIPANVELKIGREVAGVETQVGDEVSARFPSLVRGRRKGGKTPKLGATSGREPMHPTRPNGELRRQDPQRLAKVALAQTRFGCSASAQAHSQ